MEVERGAYLDKNAKPTSESKITIYKMDDKVLFKSGTVESLSNSDYKINIDHTKKTIIVGKIKRDKSIKKNKMELFNEKDLKLKLDTVISFYKEVKVRSVDERSNEIEFVFKNGNIESARITYDKNTYVISDYFINMNPNTSLKAKEKHQYSFHIKNHYLNKNILTNKLFSESNYISISKDVILPSKKYSGYKIINNTKQKV